MGKTPKEKRERLDSAKRPSKLTPELIDQICELIEEGMPLDGVMDYLGIAPQTFWTWLRKGSLYVQDPEIQPRYKIYGDFILNTRRAAAEYRRSLLQGVHTHQSWTRYLAILERRDRKNFSKFDPYGFGQGEVIDPDERFD